MTARVPAKSRKSATGQTVSIGPASRGVESTVRLQAEAAVDASCDELHQVVG